MSLTRNQRKKDKDQPLDSTTQAHVAELLKVHEIVKSGWAGVLSNGNIVDRREHPEAIPIQKNTLMGTPAPNQ